MTTPAGLPAWTRTASIEAYGGHAEKQNFLSQGAVDPRTDVTAEQINRLAADLVACARVAPVCVIRYLNRDTSELAPSVTYCRLASGVTGAYAGDTPPTGFPTLARVSDGNVTITFPADLSDDFGVAAKVNLIGGIGGIVATGVTGDVRITGITDPNADTYFERVQVIVEDDAGAISDAAVMVELWT